MGQRRKRVEWINEKIKLTEPRAESWFETYNAKGESLSLFSTVGSFTQPGFKANQTLLKWFHGELQNIQPSSSLELGAGIGNFTFALNEYGNVLALELSLIHI